MYTQLGQQKPSGSPASTCPLIWAPVLSTQTALVISVPWELAWSLFPQSCGQFVQFHLTEEKTEVQSYNISKATRLSRCKLDSFDFKFRDWLNIKQSDFSGGLLGGKSGLEFRNHCIVSAKFDNYSSPDPLVWT